MVENVQISAFVVYGLSGLPPQSPMTRNCKSLEEGCLRRRAVVLLATVEVAATTRRRTRGSL